MTKTATLGVIVGNRDFFPDILVSEARRDLTKLLADLEIEPIWLSLEDSKLGAVETWADARKCGDLLRRERERLKLFESAGISTNTIDLSEVFANVARLANDAPRVKERIEQVKDYVDTSDAPSESLLRMAKIAIVLDDWMDSLDIAATAIQCWSSMQINAGINVCTIMSMMSQRMMPSACEMDIAGVVSMYALQLASGRPSALVDWNNNYGANPNKCVLFHCGNWPTEFLPDAKMGTAPILGTTLGEGNTVGALNGRTDAGPVTIARVSTDDLTGSICAYVAEGEFTDDPLRTFGCRAVVDVPALPNLMHVICEHGFEHHAAMSRSHCGDAVAEALSRYKGWRTHHHNRRPDLPSIPCRVQ